MVVDELVLQGGQRPHRACGEGELLVIEPCQLGALAIELQTRFAESSHLPRFAIAEPRAQRGNGLIGDPEPFVGGLRSVVLSIEKFDLDQMALR